MNIANAISIGIGRRGQSGSSYWATRTPSNPAATVISDTEIDITWTDAAVAADGLKIYLNDVYSSTIAFGIGEKDITGLIASTIYVIKIVAYKGVNESTPITVTVTTQEKWFLQGGISSANAIAAYQPIKALSLAESYINVANPGTYNANPLTAPSLDGNNGWKFSTAGSTKLDTGTIPANNQTWSMVISYGGFVKGSTEQCLAGTYAAAGKIFHIYLGKTTNMNISFANGNLQNVSTSFLESVLAVAGNHGYSLSTQISTMGTGSGNITYSILIGAVNGATPGYYFNGNIYLLAIYNKVLSVDELKGLQYRMLLMRKSNSILRARQKYLSWGFGGGFCFSLHTWNNGTNLVDGNVNLFNPTDLDIDEWLDTSVTAGMKYVEIVAKDESGFCSWPTAFADPAHSPYSIGSTNWYANNGNYDLLSNLINGARSRGLGIVLYFSIRDLTHEARSGTDETTDAATYIAMIQTQLHEILTGYGAIDAIWFDDWNWHVSYNNIPFYTIRNYVESLQPNCLCLANDHIFPSIYSDIEIYESETADGHVAAGNTRLSEEIETMRTDGYWMYDSGRDWTAASMKDKATINTAVAQANGRNANYLLNFQMDTTGHIVASQKTILDSLQI